MPLYEKVRIEVYLPDSPVAPYQRLLKELDREFTFTFGDCTVQRDLSGSYLSQRGVAIADRISLIYTDAPIAMSQNDRRISQYVEELRAAAFDALDEEAVLVVVLPVFHAE